MPILELRVRKGRRRNGVHVTVASSHPSGLDRDAAATVRFAPGAGEALLVALATALGSDRTGERAAEPAAAGEREPGEAPITEPDPGAPAPVAGPDGTPGAMAGGPPGEQSGEGERPAVTPPGESGEPRVGAGESGAETGSTEDAGAEPAASGGERGVGVDDRGGSVGASASRGGETGDQRASASASARAGGRSASRLDGDGRLDDLARSAGADAAQIR